ncbi:MAG TPA: sigma 54-interacting transcriptional regulator [Vicinamibacterales bacterium]|nr:sigma 54-interacting transcriptional regulator [Vicinamibacterales bacterium]
MQVIAFPPTALTPDDELQHFERAIVTLSSRFARLNAGEIGPAIVGALEQVAQSLHVDASALVEFADGSRVSALHVWPASVADDLRPAPWMTDRLLRNEVVAVSPSEDPPADTRRPISLQTRRCVPKLAVPVVVAGEVICAIVVRANLAPRRWSEPAVERLRLLAEILAVALLRCRQEAALLASLATIERLNARLEADNVYLKEEIKTYHDFDEIVGESAPLRMALTRLAQVAPMNSSVLLLGETGTGKELFARAVHDRSRRRARALVRVNCAALPPTLVESELFGHEKGAFTGAVSMRQGRFELADGGTIFLDEIGDLSAEMQAKLLRVLQEGEFERVGSSRTKKVDVRVIAATHRDLETDVASGRFRADLYYRLSVFPISLPPLRERREDIPRLVWFFIHRHQRDLGRRITKVPQDVMQALQQHAWPGNVRELENVIERAMIRSTGDTLELDETLGRRPAALPSPATETLDDIQRAHIESVLAESGWKINGAHNAAERLGIHPNTLRFRMKKLGIVAPPRRSH